MAIKYLDAKRLQGTNAERLALTTGSTETITGAFDTTKGLYSGSAHQRAGEEFTSSATLNGETINGFSASLKKVLLPTGTLYFRCYDSSGVLQAEFGTLDVETLTTSLVMRSSGVGTDTRVLADGDRLVCEYTGGDSSNYVAINTASYDRYDGGNTYLVRYDGSTWYASTSNEHEMEFYYNYSFPNLPNGTIFNETDTYKYFMFDGSGAWNQMVSS